MGIKSKPEITKCKQSENWTRVTFKPDLAKFDMTHLEGDIVALMRKRVVDMAGTLGETMKIELNGERLATRSFPEYVKLYTDSASKYGVERPRFAIVLSKFGCAIYAVLFLIIRTCISFSVFTKR